MPALVSDMQSVHGMDNWINRPCNLPLSGQKERLKKVNADDCTVLDGGGVTRRSMSKSVARRVAAGVVATGTS